MSTHTQHLEVNETYFCTITCYKWFPLFEEADAYQEVYKWFDFLKKDQCQLLAYVIMPNHLHCLLYPQNRSKPLNKLISEGKRFMAYAIVKRLRGLNKQHILEALENGVQENERRKGKIHQVFRLSFDGRECYSEPMLEQKMDYIHHNPVSGKWMLAEDFALYPHSSAGFYELGMPNAYVTHYKDVFASE